MNTKLKDEIAIKQAQAFLDSITSSAFRDGPPEAVKAVEVVRKRQVDALSKFIANAMDAYNSSTTDVALTPRVLSALQKADDIARQNGTDVVHTPHILIGLLEDMEFYSAQIIIDAVGYEGKKAIYAEAQRIFSIFDTRKKDNG